MTTPQERRARSVELALMLQQPGEHSQWPAEDLIYAAKVIDKYLAGAQDDVVVGIATGGGGGGGGGYPIPPGGIMWNKPTPVGVAAVELSRARKRLEVARAEVSRRKKALKKAKEAHRE